MTPTPQPSATVRWSVSTHSAAGISIPVGRIHVALFFPSLIPAQRFVLEDAWVDTGAPLTVIPHHIHHRRIAWKDLGAQTYWGQQVCDLGEIELWLHDRQGGLQGPFTLIAKFARSDPPGDPVPVLLGLQCLIAIPATLWLPPPPRDGEIRLP
jgi:hypothetical protein